MRFDRAIFWGKIAFIATLFNFVLTGILVVDTVREYVSSTILGYLLIVSCFSIPLGLIASITSVRLYNTTLAAVLIFLNAFLLIIPIIFIYIIKTGFCVIC